MKLKLELELDAHPMDFVQDGELGALLAEIGRQVEGSQDTTTPKIPIRNIDGSIIGAWEVSE